jgi:hypothetical protein
MVTAAVRVFPSPPEATEKLLFPEGRWKDVDQCTEDEHEEVQRE